MGQTRRPAEERRIKMSESAPRQYSDPWYTRNRDAVIERTRKRYADRIQRLTPGELADCQMDPTKAWTIRGPKWIACVEEHCGELHEQLGRHLPIHNLTAAEYKAKPGTDGGTRRYSKNASLMSLDLQVYLSRKRKKLHLGRRLQASGRVPPVKKLIASRGERVLSQQYRLEQSERMKRGRPELWGRHRGQALAKKAEDWEIAKLAADGRSDGEIAKRVGLAHDASVGARRRRIGFVQGPKKARVYYHGRPLVGRDLRSACEDLDLTRQELADHMGLRYETLQERASPKRADQPLPATMGREFKAVYTKLREGFRHQPQGSDGGRPSLLLPSERQALRDEYKKLLPQIKGLARWVEERRALEQSIDLASLRGFVYSEARKARLRTLALWPDFFDWCGRQRDLKVAFASQASVITREFLGWAYGVKTETIRKASSTS